MASEALKAAQQRLFALRQQQQQTQSDTSTTGATAVVPASAPPAHNYELVNGQQLLATYRQRDGIKTAKRPLSQPTPTGPATAVVLTNILIGRTATTPTVTDYTTTYGPTVKCYPDIGIGAFKCEATAVYRIWLLCRWLDPTGRGCLDVALVRRILTNEASSQRLFTWRRLRQLLNEGDGRLWQWEQGNGRLWLSGATTVAEALKVERLTGKPVALPIMAVVVGIGSFRAHLYAAWHAGRSKNNPISQECQRRILHIPERTQRHYCQQANIRRTPNYALGERWRTELAHARGWEWGRAAFKFVDYNGRHGPKMRVYVARQLPNIYDVPNLEKIAKGRQKKINGYLVNYGEQGNSVNQRFFANGADAVKKANRNGNTDHYWPLKQAKASFHLWALYRTNPINDGKKFPVRVKKHQCIVQQQPLFVQRE